MSPWFYIGIIPVLSLLVIHLMWMSDAKASPDRSHGAHHVIGVVIVLVVLVTATGWQIVTSIGDDGSDHKPPLQEMQTIEASLAVKKTKVTQPQKHFKEPDPVLKKEGVSHDENKKVDPPKDEKKDPPKPNQKPEDIKDLEHKFHHPNDEDDPAGKPVTNIGDFNGNEHGFATETKGDPYFQQLLADMQYTVPAASKDEGTPVGCIHLTPDGKIPETMFMEQTTGDYQTAADLALKQLQKTRNANPIEVPDKLKPLTTKWLCFKFTVAAQ
jgi:outer membrane biosynthesis protein TonB|nr:hypothetical protein [Kofleriaceae bacterium]